MHSIDIALQLALLMALGMACQWLAWRMRLPAILPLLLAGILLGPVFNQLDPDAFLGELLFPFISLGVAIILFEGSLTLRFSDIRSVTRIIRNLTTVGVLITWGIMGAAAHYIAGLSWTLSLLFGALVSVTGPTVVAPMIRSIQPTSRIANILRWEGILVDPIGAVLAVLVFELIVTGHESESALEFIRVVVLGSVWGVAGGAMMGQMLKRHLFPDYLQNYAALAFLLLVFTVSNTLGDESGLIAVTVMGMVLANTKNLDVEELLSFKEHLTVVLISILFILLAARLEFELVAAIGIPALTILAVALFIARPLSVLVSSIGTSLNRKEIALLSWVAPRGIVAAAISALFALRLETAGVPGAAAIVPLTFVMIIGTVVIQSLTAGWFASRLGLSSRGEQGVLIAGSNSVALTLGEALMKQDIKVKIADTNVEGLRKARMLGMHTFFGNPLSEHAERFLELGGYTHLLALSRNSEANAVICARYRHEFGPKNVFSVQSGNGETDDMREGLAYGLRGNTLFARGVTWAKLASLTSQGAEVHATPLTEEYDLETYQASHGRQALQLFALDPKGKLQVYTSDTGLVPAAGWVLLSLVTEAE
jgi:NhaP-type Na+/H+ or K+/H+ antiporter